jgi:putative GTP pyrophosphokinase
VKKLEWSNKEEKSIKKLLATTTEAADLIEKMAEEMSTLMVYYRCAIMEVETKLKVLNEEFSLKHDRNPINSIKSRLKSFSSMREKLQREGIMATPDQIEKNLNDIAGVRVICSFLDDVYDIAEALLKQDDIRIIRVKDYIKNPKPNGYRSLHLIIEIPIFLQHEKHMVKVEIQLRTIAQDFWASLEHQMRYKKNFEFTEDMGKELLECATMSASLDERMEKINKTVNGYKWNDKNDN